MSTILPEVRVKIRDHYKPETDDDVESSCDTGLKSTTQGSQKQGESGNFVKGQGKSLNFALTEVNSISALIKMFPFLKLDVCQDFPPHCTRHYFVKCGNGKVREKPHGKVREFL